MHIIEGILQNVRYALRICVRTPRLALAVVGTLALGIGANTALLTLTTLAFRPLPITDPDSLVALHWTRQAGGARFSFAEYRFVRDHARSLRDLVATSGRQLIVIGPASTGREKARPAGGEGDREQPRRIAAEFVSANFFSMLEGTTAVGRPPADQPGAVLSDRLWRDQFAADSGVVGRTIVLNAQPITVTGIAARGFSGVALWMQTPDVWLPLVVDGGEPLQITDWPGAPSVQTVYVFGRLGPTTPLDSARAEMALLGRQWIDANASADRTSRLLVDRRMLTGQDPSSAWLEAAAPLAATGLVLLIACANLTNLLLARATARQREIGVRLCLGASRGRLIGQLLTESLVLALAGGASGLLLAWWVLAASVPLWPIDPDLLARNITPDARVLLFTLAVSLLTAVAVGLVPALRALPPDLTNVVRDEDVSHGRFGRSRMRGALVVAQVALCTVLLVAAALFLRALDRIHGAEPGFDLHRLLTVDIKTGAGGYDAARTERFCRDLEARPKALPVVQSVSRVIRFPLNGALPTTVTLPATDGGPVVSTRGAMNAVSPVFFDTLGIPIVRGRAFTEQERRAAAPVVVISESTARRWWPDQDPLRKTLRAEPNAPFAEIVGVARDARLSDLSRVDALLVYVPFQARHDARELGLVVRVAGDPAIAISTIRDAIAALDATLFATVIPLADRVGASEPYRIAAGVSAGSGALGLLALALAAVGLYGLVSFGVAQRTREIGVRMALGARSGQVLRLILGRAMRLAGIGLVIGIAGGAGVSRLLAGRLFGVSPFDPTAYAGVAVFLLLVSCAAGYFPAQRAAMLDPMVALRRE